MCTSYRSNKASCESVSLVQQKVILEVQTLLYRKFTLFIRKIRKQTVDTLEDILSTIYIHTRNQQTKRPLFESPIFHNVYRFYRMLNMKLKSIRSEIVFFF